jgi:heterodisulfide reductase subunit A
MESSCGCASGPKEIQASIAQGSEAAAKAIKLLSKGELELEPTSAYVDQEICTKCKLCVEVCPKRAIAVKSPAYVDEAACKGCGSCAAACPVDAIKMRLFSDEQILAQVRAATGEERVSLNRRLPLQLVATGLPTLQGHPGSSTPRTPGTSA